MRAAALFFKRENGGLFLLVGRGEPVDVVWGKRDRGGGGSLLFWPSEGRPGVWKRWVCRVRVFFCDFFLMFQNCPLLLCELWTHIYR
jgi:hypothetical protein